MIDFRLVIAADRRWCVKQSCQQVFLDVVDFGCVSLKTEQHVLDVRISQLQELAFHHRSRIAIACYHDRIAGRNHCLKDQRGDAFDQFPVIGMRCQKILIANVFTDQQLIDLCF